MPTPAAPAPRVTLVVARAHGGVIGWRNTLPWHLPEDLKLFRQLTSGQAVLMGRRTWESIGRPLPNRRNFVLSRDASWSAEGALRVASLDEAIAHAGDLDELFIIGGAQVYAATLPRCERIVLTEIDLACEGDTVFPPLQEHDWIEVDRQQHRGANGIAFSVVTLLRNPVDDPVRETAVSASAGRPQSRP